MKSREQKKSYSEFIKKKLKFGAEKLKKNQLFKSKEEAEIIQLMD